MSVIFLIVALLVGYSSFSPRSEIDARISPIVSGHEFSIARWELHAITPPGAYSRAKPGEVAAVVDYFLNAAKVRSLESSLEQARAGAPVDVPTTRTQLDTLREWQGTIAEQVQATIEAQTMEMLRAQSILSPFPGLPFSFPPVRFALVRTPDVLVVSPRDRIESISQALLNPGLSYTEAEKIESSVDALNVSAMITGIGGLGATYPTLVADDMDLRSTLDTAAHEWVHQYLAFKPLGFRYVLDLLGIAQDREATSLNETVADIVGKEIGAMVYEKYYRDELAGASGQQSGQVDGANNTPPAFDFNAEMRSIRIQVDLMLLEGRIDEAEQYMRDKRDYLAEHGYYIRKLNQAYFAFYGSYADSPTSVDPIGEQLRQLRSESGSLKRFLEEASSLTSADGLKNALGK